MIDRLFWKQQLPIISNRWRLICLAGPRQIGKTTFLKEQGNYFSFDDPSLRKSVSADSVLWLESEFKKGHRVILDEATRLPELFDAMKIMSDKYPDKKGKIWFASSSNYQLNVRIRESLAGRVFVYHVSPFLLSELSQSEKPSFFKWLEGKKIEKIYPDEQRLVSSALNLSLFPEPYLSENKTHATEWLKQYIGTYVLQDLVEGFPRTDFAKWQEFISVLLSYPAQIIPLSRIANTLQIHHASAKQYLVLAEAALLCLQLPAYITSTIKRTIKSTKLIMMDSALCQAVSGTISEGVLLENFVISQILGFLNSAMIPYKAYHWRTADEAEVDLVLEGEFGIVPIEIKSAQKIMPRMLRGINSFFEAHPTAKHGCVFYQGQKVENVGKITLLPIATLFKE